MRTSPGNFLVVFAIAAAAAAAATDGSCNQGQVGQLVALLEDYAPAQRYCAALIPAPQRASTTIIQCQPAPTASKPKRDDQSTASPNLNDQPPTSPQAQAFTNLRRSKSASYKVCDCLLASPDTTVYITTTCSATQYCSPSHDCKPLRNCNKPARCASSSYCLEAPAGACFCHPDADDPSMGYCMSAGPAERGCPDAYEDCSANADCGGSRVCIYACCREEPFCVDLDDYNPDTPNYAAPARLFRRGVLRSDVGRGVNPRWT